MVRLRPRDRKLHSGFTTPEIEKMEKIYKESGEQSLDQDFCKRLAKQFSSSQGRAGKPRVKWAEVQSWFQNRRQSDQSDNFRSANDQEQLFDDKTRPNKDNESPQLSKANDQEQLVDDKNRPIKDNGSPQVSKVPEAGEKVPDLSKFKYEARSSLDKAWYDVEELVGLRYLRPDEPEVRVRFVGFGASDDEWIRVGRDIRPRSIPLENSDCEKLQAGDLVLCFQEREDEAKYYDAYIVDIIRRMHDVRGCRCLFTIRYDHDNYEERVHSRRICRRPT